METKSYQIHNLTKKKEATGVTFKLSSNIFGTNQFININYQSHIDKLQIFAREVFANHSSADILLKKFEN